MKTYMQVQQDVAEELTCADRESSYIEAEYLRPI
jgi:hypothetical protein